MQNKFYRASINTIPNDQTKLRNSAIPFFLSVDFQNDDESVPIIKETLIRCEKCKTYLNPFVEIINPGYKWKCNMCTTINEVSIPFQMKERRLCENTSDPFLNAAFNKTNFIREELTNELYEIEAPDTFNITTPDQPIFCFLIDVSAEAMTLGVLSSVLNCARETLKAVEYDKRSKVAMIFFNESAYIFNANKTFTVVNGDVPLILSERILFSLDKDEPGSFFDIDFTKIEKYFEDKKSRNIDYLFALKVCVQAFRSATIFAFVSSAPNFGEGRVESSNSLVCKNNRYKDVAESLVRKNVCCNLFVMARSSVELSTIKIPTQYTGGQLLHYPNYDGGDVVSTSKFYCDLNDYFGRETSTGAVCRIRANEGIVLKTVYGNFYQKGSDLLSYANYNPVHNINFTIQFYNDVKPALYLQIAMARVVKDGRKLIRVMNICIPVNQASFYECCDAYAIAHCLCLDSFYYESKKKLGGKEHIEGRLTDIWQEMRVNNGQIPDSLYNLPTYVLSIMKGIPLRPDVATPADFRGYYMYMLSNYHVKIVDLMIYPVLLNIVSGNVAPLPLSLKSIDNTGLFILDTGVTIFFYVAAACDAASVASLFENTAVGPFIFNPPPNDFSKYVSELVVFLTNNRKIKPRFVLAMEQNTSVYNDIFFSYMFEDSSYQLPTALEFRNHLENRNK